MNCECDCQCCAADDLVQLRGLKVLAHCGVTDDERSRLQPIEIDIDISSDQAKAASSDDLTYAVNYEPVCDRIIKIASEHQFSLLETFAQNIIEELFDLDNKITSITVSLRKMRPPVQAVLTSAGVKVRRIRKN
ncbi:MAG: dihydroneopterin aldolase [Acidimicrobiia bacterium]